MFNYVKLLKKSILQILGRLKPKRIIIVSSATQIRYPDCYGIDMSILGYFIAFQATGADAVSYTHLTLPTSDLV